MKKFMFIALFPLIVISAGAEEQVTEISRVVNITKSGVYRFTKNIVEDSDGDNIFDVSTNDVVIDMNGFTLTSPSRYKAFRQEPGCYRLTICNGTIIGITNGYNDTFAVYAPGNDNTMENLTVVNCINGFYLGDGSTVKNCLVVDRDADARDTCIITNAFDGSLEIDGIVVRNIAGSGVGEGIRCAEGSTVKNVTFSGCTNYAGAALHVTGNSVISDVAVCGFRKGGYRDIVTGSGAVGKRVVCSDNLISGSEDISAISGFMSVSDSAVYDLRVSGGGNIYGLNCITVRDSAAYQFSRTGTNSYIKGIFANAENSVAFLNSDGCTGINGSACYSVAKRNYEGFYGTVLRKCAADNNSRFGIGASYAYDCHASDTTGGYGFSLGLSAFGCSAVGNGTNYFVGAGSDCMYGDIKSTPGYNFSTDVKTANFEM